MTNLTDAQLTALAIEHYPNPDDPDGCWSCCEAWVCPTALALAELRELRGEVGNQSCVAGRSIDTCRHCSYLRRKLADARDENDTAAGRLLGIGE